MAKKKRKNVRCKRVKVEGHRKTICRNTKTGKIVKKRGRGMVCPKSWRGKKVKLSRKSNRCYVQGRNKRTGHTYRRFVKKVPRGSKRARR